MSGAELQSLDYDYVVKILIVGGSEVGKSCLMYKFVADTFEENYIPSQGVMFTIRKQTKMFGKMIKFQIWDTSTTGRFISFNEGYYRGANGIIVVYDVTNQNSFEEVVVFLQRIEKYARDDVNKMIVGNKCDMESQRVVSCETGKKFASERGIRWEEVSAKEGTNVEETFVGMTYEILDRMEPKWR